jgi:hypothetical protein
VSNSSSMGNFLISSHFIIAFESPAASLMYSDVTQQWARYRRWIPLSSTIAALPPRMLRAASEVKRPHFCRSGTGSIVLCSVGIVCLLLSPERTPTTPFSRRESARHVVSGTWWQNGGGIACCNRLRLRLLESFASKEKQCLKFDR